jgi:hypothetical protein
MRQIPLTGNRLLAEITHRSLLAILLSVFCCSMPGPITCAGPLQVSGESRSSVQPVAEICEIRPADRAVNSIADIRRDIDVFTRRLHTAADSSAKIAAMVDLSGLYLQIVGDDRFASLVQLQGLRSRIEGQLLPSVQQMKRRAQKQAGRNSQSDLVADEPKHHGWRTGDEFSVEFTTAIVDPHWQVLSHFAGTTGPVSYHGSGLHGSTGHFLRGNGAGQLFDHGPELVSLIETILLPDFWQPAGGEGVAHYYQPLRVLVVRATTTMHEDLTDLLERLR